MGLIRRAFHSYRLFLLLWESCIMKLMTSNYENVATDKNTIYSENNTSESQVEVSTTKMHKTITELQRSVTQRHTHMETNLSETSTQYFDVFFSYRRYIFSH